MCSIKIEKPFYQSNYVATGKYSKQIDGRHPGNQWGTLECARAQGNIEANVGFRRGKLKFQNLNKVNAPKWG